MILRKIWTVDVYLDVVVEAEKHVTESADS